MSMPLLVACRCLSRLMGTMKSYNCLQIIAIRKSGWSLDGHTRLTHSFNLKQEPQPQCFTCQTTCTVKHILIECRAFPVTGKQFLKVNSLTDLFENVKIDDILSFLRETELYQKYDNLKLVNLVQTNEILLIENFTYLRIRFEIFG